MWISNLFAKWSSSKATNLARGSLLDLKDAVKSGKPLTANQINELVVLIDTLIRKYGDAEDVQHVEAWCEAHRHDTLIRVGYVRRKGTYCAAGQGRLCWGYATAEEAHSRCSHRDEQPDPAYD